MTEQEPITIILPVFGRPELLTEALTSVLWQENPFWKLLIADDGSDKRTQALIKQWINSNTNRQIQWVRRIKNIGL